MTAALRRTTAAAVVTALAVVGACTRDERGGAPVRVAVATSLRGAVADAAADYERRSGTPVEVVDAATPTVLAQLDDGAPYDVVAVADTTSLAARRDVEPPQRLAGNTLVLVTPTGSSLGVAGLAAPGRRVVVTRDTVPVGRYTRAALPQLDPDPGYAAAVQRNVVSEEANVAAVLARVAAGEADAGFVYRSEVGGRPDIRVVDLPPLRLDIASSVAVVRRTGAHPDAGRFVDFLLSPDGAAVFARHGFAP